MGTHDPSGPAARGRHPTRRPAALMLSGLLLLAAAAAYQVRASDDGSARASSSRPGGARPTGSPCVDQPCRANADPAPARGYEVPSVAVDTAEPTHIVVTDANLVGGRCGWHVTFDGGASWNDGLFEPPVGFRNCGLDSAGLVPAGNVVMGPSGTLYSVFSSRPAGAEGAEQGESVLLVTSTDGGRTFSPATVAVPGGSRDAAYLLPRVNAVRGADGGDRLLLTFWGCEPRRCQAALFAQSLDGGRTFSPPTMVSQPAGGTEPSGNSPSQAVVGSDGAVYLTFLRRLEDGVELRLARSVDGRSPFESRMIDRQPELGLSYDSAKLATDPTGSTLYTVFSDKREGTAQVFFRRSTDLGATWEPPVRLSIAIGATNYGPELSVAPAGRIDVVFYQQRAKDRDTVALTHSTDGGASFAPLRQVNERVVNRVIGYRQEVGEHYRPAVASAAEGPVVVWSDTKEGDRDTDTQDTFLRRIDLGR